MSTSISPYDTIATCERLERLADTVENEYGDRGQELARHLRWSAEAIYAADYPGGQDLLAGVVEDARTAGG